MIFVTVGTHLPFERLVAALEQLPGGEELIVQAGAGARGPAHATVVGFLPFDDLIRHVERARVVVCHAGVGSILSCLRSGKRPVVMPRRAAHGEAVDDHQVEFARRLAAAGLVTVVEDPAALAAAVDDARAAATAPAPSPRLVAELRAYIREAVGVR